MRQSPQEILHSFREYRAWLNSYKSEQFPARSIVRVETIGFGIVVIDSECPADKIPVRVESGNVWYYPIEKVHRVSARELSRYERQSILRLRLKGYQPLILPMKRRAAA